MIDHIFAYLAVLFFVVIGLVAIFKGIFGFLLYHKKVQARGKSGKRYVVTNARTRIENESRGLYGKPDGTVYTKSAVFTYEENGKGVMATAVNLLGEDNSYIDNNKIYTIKVSPFNPHKCYFPAYQLYQGCSIPVKIFIFVMRTLPRAGGLMFIGVAWFIYTSFIVR